MQRKILLIVVLVMCATAAFSKHLKGGWIYYEYLGKGAAANTSKYRITVNQYLLCTSEGLQIDPEVYVGIFDAATNGLTTNLDNPVLTIQHTNVVFENRSDFDPCISNPPEICYRIDSYVSTIDLPDNNAGYILGVQRCCRIDGIANIVNSQSAGVTYSVTIPANTAAVLNGKGNNSPIFKQNDVAVLCISSPFTLDFGATDAADNDSLVYSLCPGLVGGDDSNTPQGTQPNPPSNPPFSTVTYSAGFSGARPLGALATIDSQTGVISGIAPPNTGEYVVAVCVTEYRQGIAIANSRKEIHISVASCVLDGAYLKPSYSTCDGFTFSFANESMATNIDSYLWSFGFSDSTDTIPTPTITFPAAGEYQIKLKVKSAAGCEDSANSVLNVFPGFKADFSVTGNCLETPYQFIDKSTTLYGVVDSWHWDFGVLSKSDDTSNVQKPEPYKYTDTGTVFPQLIVTNSKGCIDTTLPKAVHIYDKPILTLPFHDTLICNTDQLQLSASSDVNVNYTWTPLTGITGANTFDPVVNPQITTTYYININDNNGCANSDSVLVNVIDHVTLLMPADTTICLTDTIQLHPVTNGIYFTWSPAETLSSDTTKEPLATPIAAATTYHLNSSVGACSADADVIVNTAPYPAALADTVLPICFGATTQLIGSFTGTTFTWSPANTLLNANTLTPTAGPSRTTVYVLTATDNSVGGCPKPKSDSVTVVVIQPIQVFAGRDTNIVVGQPLQLQATGATYYRWSPVTGMDNGNIANPIIRLAANITEIMYVVKGITPEGCSTIDSVNVFQFKTLPEIFVPSAFTPDGDGSNDIIRPIIAGMKQLQNFSIYNRWGQLMYKTSNVGQGWDGIFDGKRQPAGTYVFEAAAIDYLDKQHIRKGTVVLIR